MILLVCLTAMFSLFLQMDVAEACTKWSLRVRTAHEFLSGTDNNVFFEVNGDPKSKTELSNKNVKPDGFFEMINSIDKFETADIDNFEVCLDHTDIRTVKIWTEQTGSKPDDWKILQFEFKRKGMTRSFGCRCFVRVGKPVYLKNPSTRRSII
ncbi:uncharacterized protein LOC142350243 [Convolutriloba macropyga]|uniref:uncharacterized protein LOC142350243 n=1 Tax=Convolutriloba macropyga TaxID=536237 RepID=UPI003F52759C